MTARLLVLALLLSGCSAGTAREAAGPVRASPMTGASAGPTGAPVQKVIEVTVAGGRISGVDPRVSVGVGEQVVLRVTADVVEEIHVHGYDLYADLAPGTAAQLTFKADLPGSYEVELHRAGRPLFQLRVA